MTKKIKGIQYTNPISNMSRNETKRSSTCKNSNFHKNEQLKLNTNI